MALQDQDEKREKNDTDDSVTNSSLHVASAEVRPVALDRESNSLPPEPEYPQGWKLACIVLALMMGIFLASLDMVSLPHARRPVYLRWC